MPLLIAAARRAFRLSNRESQILSLALLGLSNKEIAGRLRISANTVKTYVRSLLAKLDVSTRSGLLWRLLDTRPALAPA
jgi:DNA-binding CsgD family transcriptional regulator